VVLQTPFPWQAAPRGTPSPDAFTKHGHQNRV